jgi:hypothetical protein
VSLTSPTVIRNAVVDTVVLGHHIPKGTDIFIMSNGPDFFSPPFPIAEKDRSESSQTAKGRIGSWDPQDLQNFRPERWITVDDEGRDAYDSTAGPMLSFGLGPRGCFGKRMAYLDLRIYIVLIVWNFELQKVPVEFSSYGAEDKMTRQPQQAFVRLESVKNGI